MKNPQDNKTYWLKRARKAQELSFKYMELVTALNLSARATRLHAYNRLANSYATDAVQNYKLARRATS